LIKYKLSKDEKSKNKKFLNRNLKLKSNYLKIKLIKKLGGACSDPLKISKSWGA